MDRAPPHAPPGNQAPQLSTEPPECGTVLALSAFALCDPSKGRPECNCFSTHGRCHRRVSTSPGEETGVTHRETNCSHEQRRAPPSRDANFKGLPGLHNTCIREAGAAPSKNSALKLSVQPLTELQRAQAMQKAPGNLAKHCTEDREHRGPPQGQPSHRVNTSRDPWTKGKL